jgi:hypothetical protein
VRCFEKCLGKQLNEYFSKWKESTKNKEYVVDKKLRFIFIRKYNEGMRAAFTKWIAYKGTVLQAL